MDNPEHNQVLTEEDFCENCLNILESREKPCPHCGNLPTPLPLTSYGLTIFSIPVLMLAVGTCTYLPMLNQEHLGGITILGGGPILILLLVVLTSTSLKYVEAKKNRRTISATVNGQTVSPYPRAKIPVETRYTKGTRTSVLLFALVIGGAVGFYPQLNYDWIPASLAILAITLAILGRVLKR